MSLLGAVVAAGVVFALFAKYLPTSELWSKLVLKTAETDDKGYLSTVDYQTLIGKEGKTLTLLRPAGMAEIEGARLDVVSEGMFIEPDTKIVVVKTEGNRIVVRKKEE
jgi:membrane-bound serine protease (ClpP class)